MLDADLSGRIRTCEQNKLHAHLFGEERVDVGFDDNGSPSPAWLIAIRSSRSTRTVRGISLKWRGSTRGHDKHDMEATIPDGS